MLVQIDILEQSMKGKIQKGAIVKDDEKFLEGINLVTGDKIDYSRNILSDSQITLLCVNLNLPKVDKFLHIFSNGEKIQKWSLFENLTLYIPNVQAAQTIFTLIQKNYAEYEEFINIMGEGFCKYLQTCKNQPQLINKKCYETIYRVMLRTLINSKFQGSELLGDWMVLLKMFFNFSNSIQSAVQRKNKMSQIKQFINGSFLMNTLPQRRKTALQMINALLQQSQQISIQAQSKVLFFNSDLNPSTRKVICNIIQKILKKQSIPQIWKCVSDYYYKDKSITIKEKAFQIMSTIHYGPNAENLFDQFDVQDAQSRKIVTKYSSKLLKTFQKQVKTQPMYQLKTFAFLNRLLIENMESNFQIVVECFMSMSQYLPQSTLINQLQLNKFDLQSMSVMKELTILYNFSSHIQLRQQLKKQIIKGLRYHEFYLLLSPKEISNVIDIFDLTEIEDINIFILMLGKQIEESKWKNVSVFLDRVTEIKFYQSHLQKMIANILKIYVSCPYFLLQKVHETILQLLLVDRKNMDIYLKIREKCLGAKNWMLRRNFIKMYTYFKMNASYEFNRSITPLVYKNIVNEKNVLIKMEFTNQFYNAYTYLDPNNQQEKVSIKEVISRFAEDKDRELFTAAKNTLQMMKQADKDFDMITQRMFRNKQVYNREIMMEQVQVQMKKHIKTQKLLPKQMKDLREKPKKGSMVEAKTTANLQKANHIEKNKIMPEIKPLTRSTSTQNKKDIQKLPIPSQNKKSRF